LGQLCGQSFVEPRAELVEGIGSYVAFPQTVHGVLPMSPLVRDELLNLETAYFAISPGNSASCGSSGSHTTIGPGWRLSHKH
jgi:hypothetical protein